MGRVSFWSDEIPMTGPRREVLREDLMVRDRTFNICAATIGNPHCVMVLPEISDELAKTYGPHIETHASFPRRTNVQFLKVRSTGKNIHIEIWERGAGYTLASGSSSSASAAIRAQVGPGGFLSHRPHARRHARHRDRGRLRHPHEPAR